MPDEIEADVVPLLEIRQHLIDTLHTHKVPKTYIRDAFRRQRRSYYGVLLFEQLWKESLREREDEEDYV